MNWEKFDKNVDLEGIKEDIKEADENSGNYEEIPTGEYEVEITNLELSESKSGKPMVTAWFKILEGKYTGQHIFYNQVITEGFQISMMKRFINSMDAETEIEFNSYAKLERDLEKVFEEVKDSSDFLLEYGKTKKGFPTYTIQDVYDK